jgi:hypothetical protein
MADAKRVQVNLRVPSSLAETIDKLVDQTREQLGPAGAKWSKNDQMVAMLDMAVPSWQEGYELWKKKAPGGRALIPATSVADYQRKQRKAGR